MPHAQFRSASFLFVVLAGFWCKFSFAQVDDHKKACGPVEAAAATKAVADARSNLRKAIETFKAPTSSDVTRQLHWFGAMNTASADALLKIYEGALSRSAFAQIWCPQSNDITFKWDAGDLAAVHGSAPGAIFLTPRFFLLTITGADSQMGTIIHELTHLAGVGLRPEVYGVSNVRGLAQSNPAKAKNNSDSFQYYVEDLVFKLP